MYKQIYLDNSATTRPKKEVIEVMLPYLYDKWYNPSSLYKPSKEIKKSIEKAGGNAPKILCVICCLTNAAYIRPDGVYVVPITALKN